ncbi:glycerophosphoryl diester phosphodiesterase membrane domain-containing protein [Lysinibacter sp. HNR]|uniref:glycerophosphoryl diester phosphodiesterase membrane domain-containing protein n=1 Tax=Lysinibacter sp. HNR TaxID=3031408 RepID=UPI002434F554|nr:glycerophosphoryl diester phosphodiesterase membrane domain-containing protein [Lysinibacter sp. HNR]WGD38036.1 glycerophosphoryl diester phosphodiesterase membrane domain-containing protein [Lysinibacter sp. HNR]
MLLTSCDSTRTITESFLPRSQASFHLTGVALVAIIMGFVHFFLVAIITNLIHGAVSIGVTQGALGRKPTLARIWQLLRPRFWTLILWTILMSAVGTAVVLIALSPLALLVLSTRTSGHETVLAIGGAVLLWAVLLPLAVLTIVWLGIKLIFVTPAIVIENLGLGEALSRSWKLTHGHFWRILGAVLLFVLIISTAAVVLLIPLSFSFAFGGSLLHFAGLGFILTNSCTAIFTAAVTVLLLVLSSIFYTVIYFDVRVRKEGLDRELIHFTANYPGETDPQSAPNPYRSPAT